MTDTKTKAVMNGLYGRNPDRAGKFVRADEGRPGPVCRRYKPGAKPGRDYSSFYGK